MKLAAALLCALPCVPCVFLPGAKAQAAHGWITGWSAAPVALPEREASTLDQGSRLGRRALLITETVHLDAAGKHLRVVLTNEFGTAPLAVTAAGVLLANNRSTPACLALHVRGQSRFTIPPGAVAVTDPLAADVERFADLTLTLSLPRQELNGVTVHPNANATSYLRDGGAVEEQARPPCAAASAAAPAPSGSWFFLKSVEVQTQATRGVVVAFGDSITDGFRSTPNQNHRYPDFLAQRLAASAPDDSLAVVNEGISGNRVLSDVADPAFGESAEHRFARDVLSMPHARTVLVLEGINDITNSGAPGPLGHTVTAEQIVSGLEGLAKRAHARGLRVLAGTLTPFEGLSTTTPTREAMRAEVNRRLRASTAFDAVVDFDAAVRDSDSTGTLLPRFDSGDHIHPNDAGYKAMADAVDLSKL